MIKLKEIGFIAGILEGEGSFNNRGSPTIVLLMTDKDVVERVGKLFKRPVYERHSAGYKTIYNLTIHGQAAIEWMFTIYSLMGERRQNKIKEIVSKWMEQNSRNKNNFSCGHPKSKENIYYQGKRNKQCRICALNRDKIRYKSSKNI